MTVLVIEDTLESRKVLMDTLKEEGFAVHFAGDADAACSRTLLEKHVAERTAELEAANRRLAAEFAERQRVLAAGVAHDFNNLLGAILAHADLALSSLPADSPVRENLESINSVAERATEIVRLLMTYAGEDSEAPFEPADLTSLVEEVLERLLSTLSTPAVFQTDLAANLPAIQANLGQLRQVVINLVTNAAEAIGEHEGTIELKTSRVRLDKASGSHGPAELPDGEYVKLEVRDTGCGISVDLCSQVFDPFFSTKSLGRGLGLATVQGIVRNHGGAIAVISTPGMGTTFAVWLPSAGAGAHHAIAA
jgi:signal transduction histidine kinase